MSNARRLISTVLAASCALAGVMGSVPGAASAFNEHITPPMSFGASGTGDGQFSKPDGVAVEQGTGDVYVVDAGNDRVEKFTASGTFISQFGSPGSGPGEFDEPTWITVAETGSNADVYVSDSANKRVEEFDPSGAYVAQLTGTPTGSGGALVPFEEVGGVAADPRGDIWVAAGPNVAEFSPAGTPVAVLTAPLESEGYESIYGYGHLAGLAVSSDGYFYGFHEDPASFFPSSDGYGGGVFGWTPNGLTVGEIDGEFELAGYEDTGVAVDPGGAGYGGKNNIYVAAKEISLSDPHPGILQFEAHCVQEVNKEHEFDDGCAPLESFGAGSIESTAGVAVDGSTGAVYVVQPNSDNVLVFAATVVPDVSTGKASEDQSTSATFNGVTDPNGTMVSSCKFEYDSNVVYNEDNRNEVQTLELAAREGLVRLVLGSESAVVNLARASDVGSESLAAALQEVIENLQSVGRGNVKVTGGSGRYFIEFVGALAHTEVPVFVAEPVGPLTPAGGFVTVAITTETAGGGFATAASEGCSSIPSGGAPVAVQAHVTNLQPGETYHYRLAVVGSGHLRTAKEQIFIASTPPVISAESVVLAPVTNAASVRATLTAQIDPVGLQTRYHVEYGPTGDVGYADSTSEESIGEGGDPVGVTVHLEGLSAATTYRLRLVASNALGTTTDEEIPTFTTESLSSGSSLLPDGRNFELVSANDARLGSVYVPFSYTPSEFLAGPPERTSLNGEALMYVAAPSTAGGNGNDGEHRGDSYLATRSPSGWTASNITPPKVNYTAGFRAFSSNLSSGVLNMRLAENGGPTPISPGSPASGAFMWDGDGSFHLLVGPWTGTSTGEVEEEKTEGYRGGTPDLKHVVIEVEKNLHLEEWETGSVSPALNVSPNGTMVAGAAFDALSPDGKDVVWSGGGNLYVSENIGGEHARTVQIDASQGSGPGGGGVFAEGPQGESPDDMAKSFNGSEVFFTDGDSAGLTSDTIAGSGANLYKFELATGKIVNLTPAQHAEVQSVVGASEDGAYVYFLAGGVLTQGADAEGKEPVAGEANLYVRHDEVTRFIATNVTGRRVTPDGTHFLLQSDASGALYVFDAEAGRLDCASCVNGKAMAVTLGNNREAGTPFLYFPERYVPHWMSDEGSRVFFESAPLVAQDTAGSSVYEWERDGAGTCEAGGGCIYLLSGGSNYAEFVDASASGSNVFFTTYSSLVPQDGNDYVDVYDARVGARPPSPPLCTGTGCQGVPGAPPVFATPSSVTFNGVGNFEPPVATTKAKPKSKTLKCKKSLMKEKGKCVKRPKVKKRAKRSSIRSDKRGKR